MAPIRAKRQADWERAVPLGDPGCKVDECLQVCELWFFGSAFTQMLGDENRLKSPPCQGVLKSVQLFKICECIGQMHAPYFKKLFKCFHQRTFPHWPLH